MCQEQFVRIWESDVRNCPWCMRSNVFHSQVSRRHGWAVLLLFFALIRAFAFFLFKTKTTLLVLWIFTSNMHLASLCRICGDKFKDHKRKVVINRFVSEIHQIRKDLLLLDVSKCSSTVKKIKERRQISTVNDVVRYTLIMHWLSGIKLKHCRYNNKQRKHQMREVNTKQHKKTNKENS